MSLSAYVRKATQRIKYRPSMLLQDWTVPHYEPVNTKAQQFHASTAKINILPGGNQSGKTTTVTHDHVMYARTKPPGCKGLILTDTYENIGENLWPHYKECLSPKEWRWIKGNQKEDNPKIIELITNGYRFYFGSYEQGRRARQGVKWDYFHPDEECPPDVWLETYRGCIARKARIGYSYTPFDNYDYMVELIEKGKDPTEQGYWTPEEPMSLLENPHVPQEEKDQWISMLSENARMNRIYGYAANYDGLVYKNFTPSKHIIEPFPIPNDWKFYRGIDFGKEHPTTSIILAYDGYTFYVIAEYYQNNRLVKYHVEEMWQQYNNLLLQNKKILPRLLTISDHDAQLRLEYENPEFGDRRIFSIPAQKERIAGVETVQSLIEQNRLLVFSWCKKVLWEFGKYHYPGKDGKGHLKPGEKADDPVKEFDDCMDPIRYCIVEELGTLKKQIYDIISVRR